MLVALLTALSAGFAGAMLNKSAYDNPTLEPGKIMGQDSSTVGLYGGGLLGGLMMILGAPIVGAPLLGIAAGSYVNRDGMSRCRTAFQEFMGDRLLLPGMGASADATAAPTGARFRVVPDAGDVSDLGPNAPATLAARLAS